MYLTGRFFPILAVILALLLTACGDSDDAAKKARPRVPAAERVNTTVDELVSTLGKVIRLQDKETLLSLYTPESRNAIIYNNRIGIGTAGTVDEQIMIEMQSKQHANRPLLLKQQKHFKDYTAVLLQWPSSREFPLAVTRISNRFYLDAIKSFGGAILLLEKTNRPATVSVTAGPTNSAIKTAPPAKPAAAMQKPGSRSKKKTRTPGPKAKIRPKKR